MAKFWIFIVALISGTACMAQEKQNEILFEQRDLGVLLERNKDEKVYLTGVTVRTPVNYNMDEEEFRKVEFVINYRCMTDGETAQRVISSTAYFIGEGANYRIFESSHIADWWCRENRNSMWQQMSFQSSPSECRYIGNSDNDVRAAKVWAYVNRNREFPNGNYTVWSTIHINYRNADGTGGERDEFRIGDTDFVKSCPDEVKAIVAFFSSKYCPENADLADALGGYSSLRDAEKALLKGREHSFADIKIEDRISFNDYPAHFNIRIRNQIIASLLVTVELQALWGSTVGFYEFQIARDGTIKQIDR